MRKRILKLLLVLVLVFVVVLAVLVWNINPVLERLRPQITQTISGLVKQPVHLGEIKVRFFPKVAIEVYDVALEGGSTSDASVKKLMLATGLASLLRGQVEVSTLVIKDANLTLTRESDGRVRLGDLELVPAKAKSVSKGMQTKDSETRNAPTPAPAVKRAKGEGSASISFEVQSATLDNVALSLVDKAAHPLQKLRIKNLDASLTNLGSGKSGRLEITASVLGAEEQNVTLSGDVAFEEGSKNIPELDLVLEFDSLDLSRLMSIAAAYDIKVDKLSFAETFSLRTELKTVQGNFHVANRLEGDQAQMFFGELFQKLKGTPFSLSSKSEVRSAGDIRVDMLDIDINGIKFQAPLTIESGGGLNIKLNVPSFSLTKLASFLPVAERYALGGALHAKLDVALPKTQKPGQFPLLRGKVELDKVGAIVAFGDKEEEQTKLVISDTRANLDFAGDSLRIEPLSFEAAEQRFDAKAKIESFEEPQISFTLSSKKFSLSPLISSTMSGGLSSLDNSIIKDLVLTGSFLSKTGKGALLLNLSDSTISNASLSKAAIQTAFVLDKKNELRQAELKPSRIQVFGGAVSLRGALSSRKIISLKIGAKQLNLKDVSAVALAKSRISVSGTLEKLAAQLKAKQGNVKPTLAGDASWHAVKGAIEGFNLLGETLGKIDQIPGVSGKLSSHVPQKYHAVLKANRTEFDSLIFQSLIEKQTLIIKNLRLEHPLYVVAGQGTISFDSSLKLKTQLKLTPVFAEELILKQPKLELLADKQGNIVIPLTIKKKPTGIPLVLPDFEALMKRAAKNTAKEAASRALDRVSPGVGQVLDSLFK